MALQAHVVECFDNKIAAQTVLFAHEQSVGFTILYRFNGRLLADDAGAEHRILVDAHHRVDDLLGAAGIADAEARHGIGLGKSVQKDRALLHFGQRSDADVFALECQLGIDFVGDNDEVMALNDVRNILQFRPAHRAAGGIGRKIQNHRLGFGRDRFFNRLSRDGKPVFRSARYRHSHSMRHRDAGRIAHVTWLMINDFVARIDNGAEGDIHRLADTDGDQNFAFVIVRDVEVFFEADADRLAQLGQSEVGGVARSSALQGVNGGFTNMPRGDEIRLADPQGDDVLHSLDDVKKIANARARYRAHVVGNTL